MGLQRIPEYLKVLETFRTVDEELLLFAGSILLGIPAGIAWDVLRLFRKLLRHHAVIVACEDIFYLICLSFLFLCYASAFGGGDFRVYYIIGCLLGFLVYYFTIGVFVMKCSDLILMPMHWLWDHFVCICIKLKLSFVKCAKKSKFRKKILQNDLQKPVSRVYNKNSICSDQSNQKKAGKSYVRQRKR